MAIPVSNRLLIRISKFLKPLVAANRLAAEVSPRAVQGRSTQELETVALAAEASLHRPAALR